MVTGLCSSLFWFLLLDVREAHRIVKAAPVEPEAKREM